MVDLIPIYLEDFAEIMDFRDWFIKFRGIQTKTDVLDILKYAKIKGSVEFDFTKNSFTVTVTEGVEGCIEASTSLIDFFRTVMVDYEIIDARKESD